MVKRFVTISHNSHIYEQKVLLIMAKVNKYTEVITIKISKQQKETLSKLKDKNVRISDFIRKAIKEKIEREKDEIIKEKRICPFGGGEY